MAVGALNPRLAAAQHLHSALEPQLIPRIAAAALAACREAHPAPENYAPLKAHLLRGVALTSESFVRALEKSTDLGHFAIVKYLLALREPEVDDLWDLIILAAKHGHLKVLEILITNRLPIYANILENAVSEAAAHHHLEIVKLLLGVSPYGRFNLRWPLKAAAHAGDLDIVRTLISSGFHLTQQDFKDALLLASRSGHQHVVKYLLKIELDDVVKRYDVQTAFHTLLQLRFQLTPHVFREYANTLIERAPRALRSAMAQELVYGAVCLEIPAALASFFELQPLPLDSGLADLKDAVATIDLSGERVDASRWVRCIDEGYVGSLLAALDFPEATAEEFEALTPLQKHLLGSRFKTYGFFATAASLATYADYRSCCARAKENYRKLCLQLRGKFIAGQRCHLGELGTPNPAVAPKAFRAWYQQIYEQLAYLEDYRRKICEEQQESLILQILTSTDACAGRTQATLSDLFDLYVKLTPPTHSSLLDQLVMRCLHVAHQKTVGAVKSHYSADAHMMNDIDGILSRFGFHQQVRDGLSTLTIENEIIQRFQEHYDLQGLVQAIWQELTESPLLATEFLQAYPWTPPQEEEYHWNIHHTALELVTRYVDHGQDALSEQEILFIDQKFLETAYREQWQALYAASARADVPTVKSFIQERKAQDAEAILDHVKASSSFQEHCDLQLDSHRWPLNPDRTVKPEAIMQYLMQRGFFA